MITTQTSAAGPTPAEAFDAVDQAQSLAARVDAAAAALAGFGFDHVRITLRDASLNPTRAVAAGAASHTDPLHALPGVVWRRRLPLLERFRVGDLHLLDGTDAWVAREFFATEAGTRAAGSRAWISTDLIVGLIRGADAELLGTVKLAAPSDGLWPDEHRCQAVGWLLRQFGTRLSHDTLRVVARRRAERLQQLQEAGASLARSLDEGEIVRELARQVLRATRAEGVVIAIPDPERNVLVTKLRIVCGTERPRGDMELADGVIAEVARTGQPVRLGDRVTDRVRDLASAPVLVTDDVVGDAGPAGSILAVPVLLGIRLMGVIALHAASTDVFLFEDEEVVATMASQAATAIANAQRYAESERERRQTEALAEVARAVGESLRPGDVLRLILRHALALLGGEGASVSLVSGDYMHIVAAIGAASVMTGLHVPVATSLMGRVTLSGERLVSNDYASEQQSNVSAQRLAPVQRAVIAPLMTARGTIGTIGVMNRDVPFSDDDGRVLQRLADHVAVAIVNARLFEEVERATREWKVAFDCIAIGMVVLDDAQRIVRCNVRAVELCEAESFQVLLGRRFAIALLGDEKNASSSGLGVLIQRAFSSGAVTRGGIRDRLRDCLYELTVSPHPDGGLVVTFDDVSITHRIAERHRRAVETTADAIVVTTPDRRISMANPAAHRLFQRSDELIGMSVHDLVDVECAHEVFANETAVLDGHTRQYQCGVLRPSGETRPVSITSAPVLELGQVTATVATLRDMTK